MKTLALLAMFFAISQTLAQTGSEAEEHKRIFETCEQLCPIDGLADDEFPEYTPALCAHRCESVAAFSRCRSFCDRRFEGRMADRCTTSCLEIDVGRWEGERAVWCEYVGSSCPEYKTCGQLCSTDLVGKGNPNYTPALCATRCESDCAFNECRRFCSSFGHDQGYAYNNDQYGDDVEDRCLLGCLNDDQIRYSEKMPNP